MADTFDINELDKISVKVWESPSIKERDYAYNLLHSSSYNDIQKDNIDNELSRDDISMDEFNEILNNLIISQTDSPNPSIKEINKQIDIKMALDR